ncbi:MAG: arginine--tRNA ligase [Alphaproteobacteria bacterium]|nr:arginine--tRNA ligase [Alphaproteobacteria bacterium]
MNLSLENLVNEKMQNVFAKLNLDKKYALVKVSDRPDLSDFQCNGALALAKSERKNPREIASIIADALADDTDLAKVSVDGPGFLNITLSDAFLARNMQDVAKDENLGIAKVTNPHKVVLDFGGPNVAKAMHVGHLRSGVIGEAVQRIERIVGNEVVSDVHLGDWGTPMGMILSEIILQDGNLIKATSYNIDEITEFYKKANIRCKEDESAKENARIITAKLQDGEKEYYDAWKYIRNVSVDAVKENYLALDVNFDLWLGESDAHETCKKIVKTAAEKGLSEIDDGATIVRISNEDDKQKLPPVILEKSDGGFTYHTTDIATIKMRVDDLKAEEICYFVDQRQSLHFEQVFKAVEKMGIAPNVKMAHYGFGTVNGADGKPFKTRDGGVMTLESLIKLSKDKVRESIPAAGEVEGYGEKEIEKLVNQVAIGAIKFQDLKNNTASGYVFDLDDFAKFEGKTGPYIQYAVARINSILRKATEKNMKPADIIISNKEERDLVLKVAQLNAVVMRAHNEKEPSIIADYAYTLAQVFSSFYNASPIMTAENKDMAQSRLTLAKLVRDILVKLLYLLGIEAPEVMLKKA